MMTVVVWPLSALQSKALLSFTLSLMFLVQCDHAFVDIFNEIVDLQWQSCLLY